MFKQYIKHKNITVLTTNRLQH